jgi:hypothetical protein
MRDLVEAGQPEQLLRPQQIDAEQALRQEVAGSQPDLANDGSSSV